MDLFHLKRLGISDWWWFEAKDELISSFLKKGSKILNIGANINEPFAECGEVHVVDIDKNALEKIKNKNTHLCDVQKKLPFPDNHFDSVIFSDVLEHLKNDRTPIEETKRVLKKGGSLIITVPAMPSLFNKHDEHMGHLRRYSKKELKEMLKGFKIKRMSYWCFLMFLPIVKKILSKLGKKDKHDIENLNPALNRILLGAARFENFLVKNNLNLPLGTTLFVVVEK